MKKLTFVVGISAALVMTVFATKYLAAKPVLPQPEHALYYQEPRAIKPFELESHKGQRFTNQQLQGKWTWVFLGYTSCPHICAPTLQKFSTAYQELTTINPNSQVIMVSVDPQRDSKPVLTDFVEHFNKDFIALRGEHGSVFPFSQNLGLMYVIADSEENTADSMYMVDHSSSVVLINPAGKIAAIFKPDHQVGEMPLVTEESMVSDFDKINALYAD